MIEILVALNVMIGALLSYLIYDRHRKGSTLDERIDDLTEGLGMMANELLARTEKILELKEFMPDISLVNANPFSGIAELIKAWKGFDPAEMIKDRIKGEDGRWLNHGQEKDEIQEQTPTIDIVD